MPNSLSHLFIAAVLLTLASSCTSAQKQDIQQRIKKEEPTEFRSDFLQSKEVIWDAVIEAFKGIPIDQLDTRQGYVESEWMDGSAAAQKQKRLKMIAYVKETRLGTSRIEMISRAEERKTGHTEWRRVPSDGELEKNILERVHSSLRAR